MTAPATVSASAGRRVREILVEAGGTVGSVRIAGYPPPAVSARFGTAEPVEGNSIAAVAVADLPFETPDAAFVDGIQRYVVEGWIGTTPVLRAYTAAAVLMRRLRKLSLAEYDCREFIVAPLQLLSSAVAARLNDLGLQVFDCDVGEREHPIVDIQLAVAQVERCRRQQEERVVSAFRDRFPAEWIVVDGSIRSLPDHIRRSRVLGVIKSHETQYLAGADQAAALTLMERHRTTVFRRVGRGEDTIYSWYLRLWDREGQDILHGLLRLEREQGDNVVAETDDVCRWLLAERAPIAAHDGRWDRLLYPISEVENYLRARVGTWY